MSLPAATDLGAVGTPETLPGLESVGEHLLRVEARLHEVATGSGPGLAEVALHLIEAGGRRLRPALVVSAAIAARGDAAVTPGVIDAAVMVELLHLASLHHDDVLDGAPTRRGGPSANAVWGNRVAVLAGDVLLSHAFALAAGLRRRELRRFCRTVAQMCAGQVAEARRQFDTGRGVADYEASVKGKTAALLATSCWLGASAAGAPEPVMRALERFGAELGVAFQLVDDLLDLCADDESTGKEPGSDLRGGVFTFPVLVSLSRDPTLSDLLVQGIDQRHIDEVRRRVRATGGDRLTAGIARQRLKGALACLSTETLDPRGRQLLVAIAEAVLEPVRP